MSKKTDTSEVFRSLQGHLVCSFVAALKLVAQREAESQPGRKALAFRPWPTRRTRLKGKPQAELDNARVVSSSDLTETPAVDVRAGRAAGESAITIVDDVGIQEVCMVEDVEELGAEFQLQPLSDGGGLREPQVKVNVSRSAQEIPRVRPICGE
jgi:hypothetical protein